MKVEKLLGRPTRTRGGLIWRRYVSLIRLPMQHVIALLPLVALTSKWTEFVWPTRSLLAGLGVAVSAASCARPCGGL